MCVYIFTVFLIGPPKDKFGCCCNQPNKTNEETSFCTPNVSSSSALICLRVREITNKRGSCHNSHAIVSFHDSFSDSIYVGPGLGSRKRGYHVLLNSYFYFDRHYNVHWSWTVTIKMNCHHNNNLICLSIVNTIYFSTSSLPNENNFIFNDAWQCKIGCCLTLTGPWIPCGNYVLRSFQFENG